MFFLVFGCDMFCRFYVNSVKRWCLERGENLFKIVELVSFVGDEFRLCVLVG